MGLDPENFFLQVNLPAGCGAVKFAHINFHDSFVKYTVPLRGPGTAPLIKI